MMVNLDLLVIGDAMIDITIKAPETRPGGAYPSDISMFPGGLANVAVAAQALGARTGFLGRVGHDAFGDLYEADLALNGVHSHLIRCDLPTGVSVNLVAVGGERTMYTSLGANTLLESEDLTDELLGSCRMIFVSGFSMETAKSARETEAVCERTRACRRQIAVGGGAFNLISRRQPQFSRLVGNYADFLILNEEEALSLTMTHGLKAALAKLKDLVDFFVVTLGKAGSWAHFQGTLRRFRAPKVEVKDTTGAGDVFTGALLAALLRGDQPEDAIKLAHQWASESVSFIGPRVKERSQSFGDGAIRD